ncbi:PASTA domain-containing protein [Desertimonas flava]|uniref:PASTA domain-containing protein n=1 Tax=Desertimonas flava TaxID=2064846 RepID=UPI0013C4FB3C|nr:PASTA domain-containing protein [Desertimonas flava]
MISTKRVALPVLLFVGVAGGLAACGDDGPETPPTTVPAETAPAPTEPEATEPGDDAGSTGDLPTEASAADLVGLTEEDAEAAAEELGWTVRVTRRDGEDLPATMDLRENRVNVEVTDGEVTAIVNIG